MTLLDHINLYFGTEFESMKEFIKDIKRGDLHDDYHDDSEKVQHLLMFLSSYNRVMVESK